MAGAWGGLLTNVGAVPGAGARRADERSGILRALERPYPEWNRRLTWRGEERCDEAIYLEGELLMKGSPKGLKRLVVTAIVGAALAAAPVTLLGGHLPTGKVALAHGGGGG